jgi:hypothetical protein
MGYENYALNMWFGSSQPSMQRALQNKRGPKCDSPSLWKYAGNVTPEALTKPVLHCGQTTLDEGEMPDLCRSCVGSSE